MCACRHLTSVASVASDAGDPILARSRWVRAGRRRAPWRGITPAQPSSGSGAYWAASARTEARCIEVIDGAWTSRRFVRTRSAPAELELVDSAPTATGVVIATYRPA